ncbi:uncharacterized protein LOC134218107 isoform X2 [Armigeres subalbatus]|uniref:uncharacterized protein LOC134218107 isoform X2 n=2 Tax=Armigeres subalbatus TaxID=124917 RepID=UPI002ECFE1AB
MEPYDSERSVQFNRDNRSTKLKQENHKRNPPENTVSAGSLEKHDQNNLEISNESDTQNHSVEEGLDGSSRSPEDKCSTSSEGKDEKRPQNNSSPKDVHYVHSSNTPPMYSPRPENGQINRENVHTRKIREQQQKTILTNKSHSMVNISTYGKTVGSDAATNNVNPPNHTKTSQQQNHGLRGNAAETISCLNTSDVMTLKQRGSLTEATYNQYIQRHSSHSIRLPYSAKLHDGNWTLKVLGEECLVTIGSNQGCSYVSQVSLERIAELDSASDFEVAKNILLANLKVVRVLEDILAQQREAIVSCIRTEMHTVGTKCGTDLNSAKCLLEMRRISMMGDFSTKLHHSKFILNENLKHGFWRFFENNASLMERNSFGNMNDCYFEASPKFVKDILNEIFDQRKNDLLRICSPFFEPSVKSMKPHHCMFLREEDVKLFNDLEHVLPKSVLSVITENFTKKIADIEPDQYCQSLPVANNVYLHVCKSLLQIERRVEQEVAILKPIAYHQNEWIMTDEAKKQRGTTSEKCFLAQLRALVFFANHFEPGKSSTRYIVPYQFKLEVFKEENVCDHYLWLCLLDFTISGLVGENLPTYYSNLFKTIKQCITLGKHVGPQSHESTRREVHSMLEFIAQIESSAIGNSKIFEFALSSLTECVSKSYLNDKWDPRRTIEVLNRFWERYNELHQQLSRKLGGNGRTKKIEELLNNILDVIRVVMEKLEHLEDFLKFYNTFSEFLLDLSELSYDWFVQIQDQRFRSILFRRRVIKWVDNKAGNMESACYLVEREMNDSFIELCAPGNIPKHYTYEVVFSLLESVLKTSKTMSWRNGNILTKADQLSATVQLISTVRNTLLRLVEQPYSDDFERFYNQTTKPFDSIISNSVSLQDFEDRLARIAEPFLYFSHHGNLRFAKMLRTFSDYGDEECSMTDLELYNSQFEDIMLKVSTLEDSAKIWEIKDSIYRQIVESEENQNTAKPKILACLATVWSIIISENVSNADKYVKPHATQIQTILRLLAKGRITECFENHFVHVPPEDGNSTVLALVSGVLQLLGNNVVIVYRNEHAAQQIIRKFRRLYQLFDIRVSYKSFDELVRCQVEPIALKAERHISNCIGLPHTAGNITTGTMKTKFLLVIDGFDTVEKHYQRTYNRSFSPVVPGLAKIQQKIWELVRANSADVEHLINSYVQSSSDADILELRSLIDCNKSYPLLETYPTPSVVQYTNRTMFTVHFKRMIKAASTVHYRSSDDSFLRHFELNPKGVLMSDFNDEHFYSDGHTGYYKPFVYFSLRVDNFVQNVDGVNNYGYLHFNVTSYPYRRLLEEFSILGVTESQHSNFSLKFTMNALFEKPEPNFQSHSNVDEWKRAILSEIDATVSANRSVIVLFEYASDITRFKQFAQLQLDHFNKFTETTMAMVPFASRTVLLVTLEMLLNIEYRPSVSTKSNGGLHVIQTYFSLDEGEETLIRQWLGRGGGGSYELIVCREYLGTLVLMEKGEQSFDYRCLNKIRKRHSEAYNANKVKQLEKLDAEQRKFLELWNNLL